MTIEDVQSVLGRVPRFIRDEVFKLFRACVEAITYKKERQEGGSFSMTRHEFEIPFWVLKAEGEKFTPEKIREIVGCYGFSGSSPEQEQYKLLLKELREADLELWRDCVIEILENPALWSSGLMVRYLVEIKDWVYVERCSERLCNGTFSALDFSDLLFYLHAFRPRNYAESLRACYDRVRQPLLDSESESGPKLRSRVFSGPEEEKRPLNGLEYDNEMENRLSGDSKRFDRWAQWRPLFMLLADDDDWAWEEFGARLQQTDVPIDIDFSEIYIKRLPLNPKRLRIMADWYAFIRRRLRDPYGGFHGTAPTLLENIVSVGGESAITELRRLQSQRAFPDAQWLSHAVLRIEDQMLAEARPRLNSADLLGFINKRSLGVIADNRDLFEWTCEGD